MFRFIIFSIIVFRIVAFKFIAIITIFVIYLVSNIIIIPNIITFSIIINLINSIFKSERVRYFNKLNLGT